MINKIINSTSLILEVENGTDSKGATIYKKKTFSGIKTNATVDDVFAVAEAIKSILSKTTKGYYLNESSKLLNN
ncbi:DUF1659 domain-containing protein [Clostridium cellulovorans]|uniref:DUF1659 domain-containing protein n=1 Tax=Clostridium cellulovorans (strain ATCC 35296 / DSM 3052 / OCM 3 / 743B) TaxID=573061 RepID=D9SUE7_CLOC7|nr:DUF1659 domain-containing protein [Clostridium cellulovorans]ADL52902.1 protein of unknown function DUF1659 [Clostridium cellulovorans 743B]